MDSSTSRAPTTRHTSDASAPDASAHDADPPDADAPDAAAPRLLTVRVAGHRYGCPLDAVREVLPAGPIARLPGAAPHLLGLLNVRGRLVTVLDLARRLHPDAAPAAGGFVLLVEAGATVAGCRVDAVLRAVPVALPEGAGNAAVGGIVLGIGEVEGEPVPVLDLPRFVRDTLLDPGER